MVYCAHCGTQNRDGSKFCNNCGARLAPESGLRCPMCSTPNPVENVFCSNCGARLVPLTAASMPEPEAPAPPIKGLSLPAKPVMPSESVEEPASQLSTLEGKLSVTESTAKEEAQVEAPRVDQGQIPDWLARLRAAQPTEEEGTPPALGEPAEELPEWISESPKASTAESPSPQTAEGEIPDWLRQARVEPAQEVPPAAQVEEETSDWLKQARVESAQEAPPAAQVEEEAPDWLKQARVEPAQEAPPAAQVEEETPDWLRQTQPQAEAAAESSVEGKEELPDWLGPDAVASKQSEAEPLLESLEAAETPALAEPQPSVKAPSEIEDDGIPDWLRAVAPEVPGTAAQEIEQPLPEQVPDWLVALKPAGITLPQPPAGLDSTPVESAGPLQGLRGVLPLALAMAEPHPSVEAPQPPSRSDGGQIFEAILAAPAEDAAPAAKPARRALTMRPLICLLLLLAVVVPFFLPFDLTGSTFSIAGTSAAGFYDTLQTIPAGSTMLLAFDYDPSVSGEMDLLAKAIVRDLIKRRIKIIAVSTLETGPQIAQGVLDLAAHETDGYVYGSSYLILYLPGHEAGLAQLATAGLPATVDSDFVEKKPIQQFPVAARIKTLSDVALVIDFAGSEDVLRTWMEQVQPRARVPIAAAVSASVEPKARAYRDAKQLAVVIGGLMGAAQYEVLSNQPQLAVISVNAQTAAQLVLVFVIVLGNVVYWISRARGHAR